MAEERGVSVVHTTIMGWVFKYSGSLDRAARKKKKTGIRYIIDETYIKGEGVWKYLYQVVDKLRNIVDYLFTAKRNKKVAGGLFKKEIRSNPLPDKDYI